MTCQVGRSRFPFRFPNQIQIQSRSRPRPKQTSGPSTLYGLNPDRQTPSIDPHLLAHPRHRLDPVCCCSRPVVSHLGTPRLLFHDRISPVPVTVLVDRPFCVCFLFPSPFFYPSSPPSLLPLLLIPYHVLLGPSEPDRSGPNRLAPRHCCLVDATTGDSFNCKANSYCLSRYCHCHFSRYHPYYCASIIIHILLPLCSSLLLHAVDRLLAPPHRGP